jgi:hypothetical protein
MTSDQRKFESLAALCDSLAQNASPPRNASTSSIWPISGGRWRPVQEFTKFLFETGIALPSMRG